MVRATRVKKGTAAARRVASRSGGSSGPSQAERNRALIQSEASRIGRGLTPGEVRNLLSTGARPITSTPAFVVRGTRVKAKVDQAKIQPTKLPSVTGRSKISADITKDVKTGRRSRTVVAAEERARAVRIFKRGSDVASSIFLRPAFLPSLSSQTGKTGEELLGERSQIRGGFLSGLGGGVSLGLPGTGDIGNPFAVGKGVGEAQARGFAQTRELRAESEGLRALAPEAEQDIATIEAAQPGLQDIQTRGEGITSRAENLQEDIARFNVEVGGKELQPGQFSNAEARREGLQRRRELIFTEQTLLQTERRGAIRDLEGKGITVTEGDGLVSFSSENIQKVSAGGSAGARLLAELPTRQKVTAIGGALVSETAQFATLGLASGVTGTSAKIGSVIGALPKAGRIGVGVGSLTLVGASAGFGAAKGFTAGTVEGSPISSAVFGGLEPLAKVGGFAGGSIVGGKVFSSRVLSRLDEGSIGQERFTKQGVGRGGLFKTEQVSIKEFRVPGTRLTIKQRGAITDTFETAKQGIGRLDISTTLKGAGRPKTIEIGGAFSRQGTRSGINLLKVSDTRITSAGALKTKIQLSQLRVDSGIKDFNLSGLGKSGDTRFFVLRTEGTTSTVGKTQVFKSADALLKNIDVNRPFSIFRGEDTTNFLTSSTQRGKITIDQSGLQTFFTGGTSKQVSPGLVKGVLQRVALVREDAPTILTAKGGQLRFAFPKPTTTISRVTSVPRDVLSNVPVLSAAGPSTVAAFGPTISSAIGTSTLLGTATVSPIVSASSFSLSTSRLRSTPALGSLSFSRFNQIQSPLQFQPQAQTPGQVTGTQLISQQLLQTPQQTGSFIFAPIAIGLPGIAAGGFGFGGGGIFERPAKRRRGKQRFKRTPSFGAAALGITAFAPVAGEFTGLVERPIIVSRKKKKKRR